MAATSKKKARKKTVTKVSTKKKVAKKKKSVARKAAAKKTAKKKSTSRKAAAKKTTKKKKTAARKKSVTAKKKTAVRKKSVTKKKPVAKTKKTAKKAAKRVARVKVERPALEGPGGDTLVYGIAPYRPKRGEEYMNSPQLQHFRNILQSWREQLIEEINRTIHAMQDETVNHPDPNDRASQETDMSIELRSRDRERKLIKKIDDTLALIDAGDYGYCENCGVEIGVARLEARPTATLCIDCKTLDEIRERQMV